MQRRAVVESDLYPLVDSLYEAATRPDGWTVFLDLIRKTTGSDVALLQIFDSSSARGRPLWHSGIPDAAVADYPQWVGRNPHLAAVTSELRTGSILPNTPLTRAQLLDTEYFNDYVRRHLPIYASSGVCVFRQESFLATLTCDREFHRPGFGPEHANLFRVLFPHLQRAVAIYRRFADAEMEQKVGADALDRLDFGVVFLSEQGEVLTANKIASAILEQADGLLLKRGRLVTDSPSVSVLNKLIGEACRPQRSIEASGGAVRVPRVDHRLPLEIFIAPIRLQHFALASRQPVAVVFIHDPGRSLTPLKHLQELYGFTAAESRVAQRLRCGETVSEIAQAQETAVATVRTHVQRILGKTDCRSLSDLVRRLASLPSIQS